VNYYEHHLGDWAAATGHLTWDEDMAYTRLLRAYYHHEQAIADGQQYRLAKAVTPAQRRAVDQVLNEFFQLLDGRYHQKRADSEIARYQDKQRKAKASADARWSQSNRNANASANAMRTHSEGNALQTPDTRHQETPHSPPRGSVVRSFPPGFDRLWDAYPKKKAKDAAAKAFAKRRPDEPLLALMLAAIAEQKNGREWAKDGGQFIPHLSTWLNEGRWQDEDGLDSVGDLYAGAI
jgi:uncharacterized protein YdaU (DUF1376 family)